MVWIVGLFVSLEAQTKTVNASFGPRPILEVLDELVAHFDLEYTAAEADLADCEVMLQLEYSSLDEALRQLLGHCNLTFEKIGSVYFLQPSVPVAELTYSFSGLVIDKRTLSPIPFVVVDLGTHCILTDEQGVFNFQADQNHTSVQLSHLAYETMDTLVLSGQLLRLSLEMQTYCLEEVIVDREQWVSPEQLDLSYEIVRAYQNGSLRAGYYRSFQEFMENAPSIPWGHPGIKEKKEFVVFGKNYEMVKLNMEKERGLALGNFVGFCDGKHIYFRLNQAGKAFRDKYSKVVFRGYFVLHPATMVTWNVDAQGRVTRWTSRETRVYNMKGGSYFSLNRRSLRAIISVDQELLDQFEQERRKGKKLEEYLFYFLERNL